MIRNLLSVFWLLLSGTAFAATISFPVLSGRVVDQAHIIDPADAQHIEMELQNFESSSGKQIVLVTIPSLQGKPIEDYGYQLGRYWGIGQKGKNTGALIIIAPNEHETRIEVGYGLEGELTDAKSKIIIEQIMIPRFKNNDYTAGAEEGVSAVIQALGGDANSSLPLPANMTHTQESFSLGGWIIPLLFLFFMFRSFGRRRSGLLTPLLIGTMLGGRSDSGWGGGGFSGGGGSFGGGGASGRW